MYANTNNSRVEKKRKTPTIRQASMAKAVVKSLQDIGNLALKLVSSRINMRNVTQKQKHHENIHQIQKDTVVLPTDATRLKEIQVKITSSILTMPTGPIRVLKSMMTVIPLVTSLWFWRNVSHLTPLCPPSLVVLMIFLVCFLNRILVFR